MLAQLGGQGDLLSTVVWFLLFFVFIFLTPRLMTMQTVFKLESDVAELEQMTVKSQNMVLKRISKNPSQKLKEDVKNFMEFFAVSPVDVDPYGVVKRIDMVIKQSDARFRWFVKQVAPDASYEVQQNIRNGLAGAMTTYQIAKIVRHFLELIKKYKMFQLAMVLQMQIPLVIRTARASMYATKAFVNGHAIGDSIGPLVAAKYMHKPKIYKEYEFVVSQETIGGRKVFVTKALGPGATVGYPGKFINMMVRKYGINRLITIDAGLKLEGEKTGGIAEGVGVAMGGTVDRYEIETAAVSNNMPLDAIVIKENEEEALMSMRKEIIDSIPFAMMSLENNLKRIPKNDRILIIGVGNTCGVGNDKKAAENAEKNIREHIKKSKEIKEERKKWIFK